MEKNGYKLFVDLDEVLVDFNGGYKKLTGIDISGTWATGKEFWKNINDAGSDFWANLDWTHDGKQLWDYVEKYEPVILSTPSREKSSRIGKQEWVEKHLPGFELILEFNKEKYAKPNHVLIDDRDSNIMKWIFSKGIGILHTSTDSTIEELKKLCL